MLKHPIGALNLKKKHQFHSFSILNCNGAALKLRLMIMILRMAKKTARRWLFGNVRQWWTTSLRELQCSSKTHFGTQKEFEEKATRSKIQPYRSYNGDESLFWGCCKSLKKHPLFRTRKPDRLCLCPFLTLWGTGDTIGFGLLDGQKHVKAQLYHHLVGGFDP